METVLVSACLMGVDCRYDGGSRRLPELSQLMGRFHLVPVCGEAMGGLPTPRIPAERMGDRVINREGADVTEAFHRGAEQALRLARLYGCRTAILKERSPSCGSGEIYDGSFSGTLRPGFGVTAALLLENGIRVLGESEVSAFLQEENGKI